MTQLRFLTDLPLAWPLLAVAGATAAAWWLAHRETRDLSPPRNWLLPSLRAAAVGLIVAMLLEPSLHHRQFVGEPSRLRVWLDGSASMQETDTVDAGPAVSRYQRSVDLLAGGDIPRLEIWAGQGEVEVRRFTGDDTAMLWQSLPTQDLPPLPAAEAWTPEGWSRWTSLTPPLEAVDRGDVAAAEESVAASESVLHEPLLLFTDGRHNQGDSPLDLLNRWPQERAPVWIVGMGSSAPPPRMTITQITTPEELFRSDRLEGILELRDNRPAGEAWQLSVRLDGAGADIRPLWTRRLVSDGQGARDISFGFPLEPVVKSLMARGPQGGLADETVDTLAVPLVFEVQPASGEQATFPGWQQRRLVGVTTRRQRVLLLDSRSRWETRYLRNALERDPRWDVDAFLMKPRQSPEWFAQQNAPRPFPETPESWLDYDLVITGEIEANAQGVASLRFLREAVERGGTGWIVIDGQRDTWRRSEFASLREMFPVQRQPTASVQLPGGGDWKPVVVERASGLGALQLGDGSPASNRSTWDRLPGLVNIVPVRLLPGAESLVDLQRAAARLPLLTTRLYGGGRVVHLASDETWRWRYEVADEIHQRLWNQLARFAMRLPFAVRNDYAALDSGPVTVTTGTAVPVRALLRDSSGLPTDASLVRAVASRDGRIVSSVALVTDPTLPGLFQGQWDSLPPGTYTIRLEATGFPPAALALETRVEVVAVPTAEELDVTRDEAMLRQIAEQTGGLYVPEERVEEMWDKIALESTGRVVENETEVWQSGWWLALATGLLGVEWWFRKKAGLI